MADLTIRSLISDGTVTIKMIDQEQIVVCSPYTKAQIKTYLQNNRPALWTKIQTYTAELSMQPCPYDGTKKHYTLLLDRP